jgi:2,3-dihydroxybenzoate decarboxylase
MVSISNCASLKPVPCYIHPRGPIKDVFEHLWAGRTALLSAPFQFATGVAAHVLGLASNGVFDRFPKLQIIIGHLGENVIAGIWRFDHVPHLKPI